MRAFMLPDKQTVERAEEVVTFTPPPAYNPSPTEQLAFLQDPGEYIHQG